MHIKLVQQRCSFLEPKVGREVPMINKEEITIALFNRHKIVSNDPNQRSSAIPPSSYSSGVPSRSATTLSEESQRCLKVYNNDDRRGLCSYVMGQGFLLNTWGCSRCADHHRDRIHVTRGVRGTLHDDDCFAYFWVDSIINSPRLLSRPPSRRTRILGAPRGMA